MLGWGFSDPVSSKLSVFLRLTMRRSNVSGKTCDELELKLNFAFFDHIEAKTINFKHLKAEPGKPTLCA